METKTVIMPPALTAENGAKAAMMGEFSETVETPCMDCLYEGGSGADCNRCNGSGTITLTVPVSWTTIKAIYAKAVELLGV